jgi:hypothetical protein
VAGMAAETEARTHELLATGAHVLAIASAFPSLRTLASDRAGYAGAAVGAPDSSTVRLVADMAVTVADGSVLLSRMDGQRGPGNPDGAAPATFAWRSMAALSAIVDEEAPDMSGAAGEGDAGRHAADGTDRAHVVHGRASAVMQSLLHHSLAEAHGWPFDGLRPTGAAAASSRSGGPAAALVNLWGEGSDAASGGGGGGGTAMWVDG